MPTAKPEIVYVNQQAQRQNQQMENGVANTNNINGNMVQQSQGYSRQPPAPQNFPPNAQFSSVNGAYQVVGKNPNQREVVTMNSAQVSQPMPTQVQPAIPNNQAVTYNQQPYMKPQSPQKFNVANNNNNMKGMSPMPFMVEEVNMYGQYGAQKEIEQSVQVINQQPRVVTQPPTQPVY